MTSLERGEPASAGSAACTDEQPKAPADTDGGQSGISKPVVPTSASKRINFYFGITINLGGITAFLTGAFSNHWIVVVSGDQGSAVHFDRLLANLGPWQACNQVGRCDALWNIAPGLGEDDKILIQGVQALVLLASLTYLAGAVVIVLRLAGHRLTRYACCRKLLKEPVPECLTPVAAVLAFLSILLTGELKQRLIPGQHQSVRPGWAFTVCLLAITTTVAGSVLMILYRQLADMETTSLLEVIVRAVRAVGRRGSAEGIGGRNKRRRRRSGRSGRLIPSSTVSRSDVHVSVVGFGALSSGGGWQGVAEEGQGQEDHCGDQGLGSGDGAADHGGYSGGDSVVCHDRAGDLGDVLPQRAAVMTEIDLGDDEGGSPRVTTDKEEIDATRRIPYLGQRSPPDSAVSTQNKSPDNPGQSGDSLSLIRGDTYSSDIAIPRPRHPRRKVHQPPAKNLKERRADWSGAQPIADLDTVTSSEPANHGLSRSVSPMEESEARDCVDSGQTATLAVRPTNQTSEC